MRKNNVLFLTLYQSNKFGYYYYFSDNKQNSRINADKISIYTYFNTFIIYAELLYRSEERRVGKEC